MRRNVFDLRSVLSSVIAAAVFVVGLSIPAPADAQNICGASRCNASQTRVRLERKSCKANKKRPAITVARACCQKPNGKIRCKKYPKCPKKSPSSACV